MNLWPTWVRISMHKGGPQVIGSLEDAYTEPVQPRTRGFVHGPIAGYGSLLGSTTHFFLEKSLGLLLCFHCFNCSFYGLAHAEVEQCWSFYLRK